MILAIDPGCTESAYCLIDENMKPVEFGKFINWNVRTECRRLFQKHFGCRIAIEMVAHYGTGMPAGKEIFETCLWIGRFMELFDGYTTLIYRKDEKINLCGNMKAKDGNIIQALKDRFGDKGTKNNPGWFYGFKDDIWQAYTVGVTYADMYLDKKAVQA